MGIAGGRTLPGSQLVASHGRCVPLLRNLINLVISEEQLKDLKICILKDHFTEAI